MGNSYSCGCSYYTERLIVRGCTFRSEEDANGAVIAVIVPAGLFIISVITLIIISRSVQVGDDAKMRCRYCVDKQEVEGEDQGLVEATSSTTQSQVNENEIRSMTL